LDRRTIWWRGTASYQLSGTNTNPHFSPDGKWIAFSAEYAGNTDVYVCRAKAASRALTWHPGPDSVQGWTPDGKERAVYIDARVCRASAAARFWTVPATGGVEEPMALPRGYQGRFRAMDRTSLSHE